VSKGSKERIGQSIDGILGNLTIRGRESEKDKELEELRKRVVAYENLGSIDELRQEKEELLKAVSELKKEHVRLQSSIQDSTSNNKITDIEELSLYERDQHLYEPTIMIGQYCEQAEGKRKLTIHLREIEYQAILKASHLHSSKGQLMDTITKALRFYIPRSYYVEAEREVSLKAIQSVRGMLEQLGFSKNDIEKKLK
jgi:hypothetical protein